MLLYSEDTGIILMVRGMDIFKCTTVINGYQTLNKTILHQELGTVNHLFHT